MPSFLEAISEGLLRIARLLRDLIFVRPLELVLLVIVVVVAMLAVRILLDLTSAKHRRRYTRVVKYCLVGGFALGVVLPWFEEVGLSVAAAMSIVFLMVSVYYYLLRGRASTFSLFYRIWVPRERIRDWFLYFSVLTGVIGIVSTLLSILIPPFLSLTLGSVVPLAFDTLSVLSALMEFTITVPPYTALYGLAMRHLSARQGSGRPFIEDLDFPGILANTSHSHSDLLDALESLARDGMAIRSSPEAIARIRFTLGEEGIKLMESCGKELAVRLQHEREVIESTIDYLTEKISGMDQIRGSILKRALDELAKLRTRLDSLLQEYGMLIDQGWVRAMLERIERVRLQLTATT